MSVSTFSARQRLVPLIAVVLVTVAVESLALIVGGKLVVPRLSFVIVRFDTESVRNGYREYLDNRHPVLGWPTKSALKTDAYGPSGARPSPAFLELDAPCVTLFGDSFTYSEQVDDQHAWGDALARRLNCRVANYGVGGYGTDQALLRAKEIEVLGQIAILGIHPENVLRNVNQYRGFLGDNPHTFKPRFLLEPDGGLRLVPLPTLKDDELALLFTDTTAVLSHETFLPGSRYGPVMWRAPYAWSLFRGLFHPRVTARLTGGTSWGSFLAPEHITGALNLTVALASEFDREARSKGALETLVVVFTSPSAFFQHEAGAPWAQQPLIDGLHSQELRTLDIGPVFREHLKGNSICTLMRYPEACDGHYNEEGYLLVAESVAARIQ
jgi:hypothetical protein